MYSISYIAIEYNVRKKKQNSIVNLPKKSQSKLSKFFSNCINTQINYKLENWKKQHTESNSKTKNKLSKI